MESIKVFGHSGYRARFRYLLAVIAVLLLVAAASRCQAQTWAEWFKQKKTQKKYLVQQIAALQVYIGYAKKGYEIVGSGLETLRGISNGEFSLHSAFISGLKQVSPLIRRDARIAEIVLMQLEIVQAFSRIKGSGFWSADQLAYLGEVGSGLLSECYTDLEELLLVMTSGRLEMKEEERLSRLESVYQRMLDKAAFSRKFCGEADMLIRAKEQEQLTLDRLRRYYELE